MKKKKAEPRVYPTKLVLSGIFMELYNIEAFICVGLAMTLRGIQDNR